MMEQDLIFLYLGDDGMLYDVESREQANYVCMPISDYNGYQKALRIVRDRARQQVDKAKADRYGYTLLRADFRPYTYKSPKAWLITKSTPYSIKMDLGEVQYIIGCDLRDYYGYRELPAHLGVLDMLDYCKRFYMDGESRIDIQNEEMLEKLAFLDECGGKLAFELSRISSNFATGTYEISYWATALV